MPIQTQSGGHLTQHDSFRAAPQRPKAVSFQTPAANTAKKARNTGRRAFGDISNRKLSSQASQSLQKPTSSSGTTKAASKSAIRLERERSTTTSVKKQTKATSQSSHKANSSFYESIERPYGLTGKELDDLYDSDGHVSVCSLEKEGFVVSRQETETLIQNAMTERRANESNALQNIWKNMEENNRALLCQDGEFVKRSLQQQMMDASVSSDHSLVTAWNDLNIAVSDDEEDGGSVIDGLGLDLDLGIPL